MTSSRTTSASSSPSSSCLSSCCGLCMSSSKGIHGTLCSFGLFTMCLSLSIGLCCANMEGKTVLESVILMGAVVSSLTGYTFWASKKGKDFKHLGPILLSSLIILIVTGFIQLFFPLGPISGAVYSGIGAMVFSGMVIYDTDNLIKRFTYDDYTSASVTLYLDILNLFLKIMRILRAR